MKIRILNTSINLHSDTALFTALFEFTEKWERVNFKHCTCVKILPTPQQTVFFILTWIQCVVAFKYHIPMKLGLFYFAFSIDTWPYLLRVSLAFACDLRRRSGRQTHVIACKRRVRVHGRGIKNLFQQCPSSTC